MRRRNRAGAAWAASLAVLSACSVLSGCSLGEPAPPEGFRVVRTARVELAYPAQWRPGHDPKAAHMAESTRQGSTLVRIAVLERLGSATGADLALAMAQSSVQLFPGYRVRQERGVEVEGARSARRADYSYVLIEGPRRTRTPVQAMDLAMVDSARNPAVVRISWRAGALDAATVDRIAATVTMRSPEG